MNLNTATGNFSFKPFAPAGEFLVNIKVSSYRNGQRIADVYRYYDIIIDTLPGDKYNTANKEPKINFRSSPSSPWLSTLSDTIAVGDILTLQVRAEDYDSLSLHELQSVSLRMIPQPHQIDPWNSSNCIFSNCAWLDTNNTAWKDTIFSDTSVVIANLEWTADCEHLEALNSTSSGGLYKTYSFSFIARDNICPFPLQSIGEIFITVMDTSTPGSRPHRIEALGDDNVICWPLYSGTSPFTSYKLYRSDLHGGPYGLLKNFTSISDTSFTDTTCLASQMPYFYKVETASGYGCFPFSNSTRSLHLDALPSGNKVRLLWNDLRQYQPTPNTGTYKVWADTGTGWVQRASLNFTTYTWTDQLISCHKTPRYFVTAYDQTNAENFTSNVDSLFVARYGKTYHGVCPGDSAKLAGVWRNIPGVYMDTVSAAFSGFCDSVVERILFHDSVYQVNDSHYLCQGDSIKLGNSWQHQAGTYPEMLQSNRGCDSLVLHQVSMLPSYFIDNQQILCHGDTFYDPVLKMYIPFGGSWMKYLSTTDGCDSNYRLTLTEVNINSLISYFNGQLHSQQAGATYQWFNCINGQPVPGATTQSWKPKVNGSYKVRITLSGCAEESECLEVTNVGLNNLSLQNVVRIYPNPAGHVLYINFQNPPSGQVNVSLHELTGALLKSDLISVDIGTYSIDINNLSPGIYFLQIAHGDEVAFFRFVKE